MCGAAACAQRKAARRSTFDHRIPVGGVQLGERPLHVDRRHVDQDVEAAERLDDRRDQGRGGIRLRQIGLEGGSAAPGGAHGLDRQVGFRLRARVADGDVDAARRQIACDYQADAFAARDERDFVNELHDR